MAGLFVAMANTSFFTSVTVTYSSVQNGTETVPTGASSVIIHVEASGGAGGTGGSPDNGGGGGGGYSKKTIAVIGGNTFSYNCRNGSLDATVSGTVAGGSVSITANGGGQASGVSGGAGGSASGGDENEAGNAGQDGDLGPGSGGVNFLNEGFGYGNGGGIASNPASGRIRFIYS